MDDTTNANRGLQRASFSRRVEAGFLSACHVLLHWGQDLQFQMYVHLPQAKLGRGVMESSGIVDGDDISLGGLVLAVTKDEGLLGDAHVGSWVSFSKGDEDTIRSKCRDGGMAGVAGRRRRGMHDEQ